MSIKETPLISIHAMPDKDQALIGSILKFWFSHTEETTIPSEMKASACFPENIIMDDATRLVYAALVEAAAQGDYQHWQRCIHGQLALILLLDQFPRHLYPNDAKALRYDPKALDICVQGAAHEQEHALTLIERAFYYCPLLHSEDLIIAEQAIYAYSVLAQYALEETQGVYDSFLKMAQSHYKMIQLFGRFPDRNACLGRKSSQEEILFLNQNRLD